MSQRCIGFCAGRSGDRFQGLDASPAFSYSSGGDEEFLGF